MTLVRAIVHLYYRLYYYIFSALSRRVGALQISIIIIVNSGVNLVWGIIVACYRGTCIYILSLCLCLSLILCLPIGSVVKSNPPRKAVAENLETLCQLDVFLLTVFGRLAV